MSVFATGTAYTPHVGGALPAGQDDGALRFNQPVSGGYYIQSANNAIWTGVSANFTVIGWVKPTASASSWRGGIFSNQTVVAGSPSHEEGWSLEGFWSGGNVNARLTRAVNNAILSASSPITVGVWTFVAATYDGTTIRLYVSGSLVATQADSRAQTADAEGQPTIDRTVQDTTATVGQFYGAIDEVAFWGTVLSAGEINSLYLAGIGS